METKYFSFIESVLANLYPLRELVKYDPRQKIEMFHKAFQDDIKIDAMADMAKLEIEAEKDEALSILLNRLYE